MTQQLTQGLAALDIIPPAGAVDQLVKYSQLLLAQNQVMNLTAITQPDQVAALHFLDSAALLNAADLNGKSLIDVGTGAGLPGLPLKILEPTLTLTLLDSLGKRVDWLSQVAQQLGLEGITCLHARAEEQALDPHDRERFDVATSRAVAPLNLLCELCLPFVKVGGRFLAMKSVDSDFELSAAQSAIARLGGRLAQSYDYTIPNTDVTHRVIIVEKFTPTPKGYPRRWAKIQKAPL